MKHEEAMRAAILQARKTKQDVPVGAVVVRDGKIISVSHNRREEDNAPFAHAEMLAMEEAARVLGSRRLNGCTLYVTLEPCPMCAGAMVMAGIDQCVFGAFDSQYGCCGSLYHLPMEPAFRHTIPCIGGVLREECEELIKGFFENSRLK